GWLAARLDLGRGHDDHRTHPARVPGDVSMRGFATQEGTAGYRQRLETRAARGHFKTWQGLRLSSVGIGTYLGAEDDATDRAYEAAVTRALELGISVVDTAVTYRHQRSERSVGAALRTLVADGTVAR